MLRSWRINRRINGQANSVALRDFSYTVSRILSKYIKNYRERERENIMDSYSLNLKHKLQSLHNVDHEHTVLYIDWTIDSTTTTSTDKYIAIKSQVR